MGSVQNNSVYVEERRFDLAKHHDTIQPEHGYSDWVKRECDEEIFGNLDASQSVYAVLDATKITNLPELLSTSELEYRCLFIGEAAEQLGVAAPWIVKLSQEDKFTQRLFRVGKAP